MRAVRGSIAAAVACALSFATPAWGTTTADREAARALAGEGYEQYEAAHYQRAIEMFQKAEARFHAPPHLLYIARAQLKLGRMLEAIATYQRVVDEKLAADAPAPFREAQVSARAELGEITPLVPSLTISFEGGAPPGVRVLLDGEQLPASDFGRPLQRNPGNHKVFAVAPGLVPVERTIDLQRGAGEVPVPLQLAPPPKPSIVPGVVTLSLGAVGLGVGTTAAVLSRGASGSKAFNLRVTEITGFAVGGAGVVTGVVLLALRAGKTAAPAASLATPRVNVGLGVGSVNITGAF